MNEIIVVNEDLTGFIDEIQAYVKELTPPYKVTCQDGSFHGHATQFGLTKKVD